MARSGADVLVKRNAKLEAFLRRNLDEDTFERIRAHEACIVCSEKEDKAFKFVVLGDEWIYLTENPPKRILETVHLADIIKIELLNEFPDFLSGEERENTQHIVVTYLTDEPKKGRRKKGSKSPRTARSNGPVSARGPYTALSWAHQNNGSFSSRKISLRDHERKSSISSSSSRRNSLDAETLRTALTRNSVRTGENPTRKISDDYSHLNGALSLRRASECQRPSRQSAKARTHPAPTSRSAGTRALPRVTVHDVDGDESRRRNSSGKSSEQLDNSTNELRLALEELSDNGEGEEMEERGKRQKGKKQFRINLPESHRDRRRSSGSSGSDVRDPGLRRRSLFGKGHRPRSASVANIFAQQEVQLQLTGSEEAETTGCCARLRKRKPLNDTIGTLDGDDEEEWRRAKLHLYFLNLNSPFLMLSRSAWNNYLLRATLMLDDEYAQRLTGYAAKITPGEKMDLLFGQLKTELLNAAGNMEETFELVNELKTAAERNFALRKLFWKTAELFTFMVRQLSLYLPKSSQRLPGKPDSEEAKRRRADELELVILLVETLSMMLRETEIVTSRLQSLRSHKGRYVVELLAALTCSPVVPPKYVPPTSKPKSERVKAMLKTQQAADNEIIKLLQELTDVSTWLLYEIILIANQVMGQDADGHILSLPWLISTLEEQPNTEEFIRRVVACSMSLLHPSVQEPLLPANAVLVYQQFYLLQSLIKYSRRATDIVRNNFYEEFKYYIQGPIIQQKFPDEYAIAVHTMSLIEEVVSAIIQRPVSLQTDDDNDPFASQQ